MPAGSRLAPVISATTSSGACSRQAFDAPQAHGGPSRRHLLRNVAGALGATFLISSAGSANAAERGISQYVKKRKLDPIESYIPPILAAKLELQLAKAGLAENLEEARQLLRTGPFDGVRDNVRALGVYGAESGRKAEADAAVGDVFGALNALDSDLFQMSRGRAETNGAQLENRCDALIEGSRTAPLNSGGPYGLFGGRQLDIQKYYLNVNSMACKAPCSLVTFKILPMVQHAQAFDRLLAILPEDAVRQGEQVIQKLSEEAGMSAAEVGEGGSTPSNLSGLEKLL